MSFDTDAKKQFDMLSEEEQNTIVELMIILNKKISLRPKRREIFHLMHSIDAFKDGHEYMADDFDAIPEGFEE